MMKMGSEQVENNKDEFDGRSGTKTRIYVGGVGVSVTADDLVKTFSSLGKVESADIVRTKDRSFAYLDFLPSSDKALAKLFSTYNGCMWKGGRLRLEKAKEHYLLRLKREWVKDAELVTSAPSSENIHSMEELKKVPTEKMELRIFFPKLKKVKSVPFRGTGKHKYSFQRIEVPSLPIHFCDCEEHSHASHLKLPCDLETGSGGIKDEELNMMKSVMNKIFQSDNSLKILSSEAGLAKEEDNAVNTIQDLLVDENEKDYVTDEDNLIINMVAGGSERMTSLMSQKQGKITAAQESIFHDLQTYKDPPASRIRESQKRKVTPFNKKENLHKKQKLSYTKESDGIEIVPASAKRRETLQTQPNEPARELEAQTTKSEFGTQESTNNLSWSQKSTWRDLVAEGGSTAFHMSHLLPSVASKEELLLSDGLNVPCNTKRLKQNVVKHGNLESQSSQSKELKKLVTAAPMEPNAAANKYARGASWLQKSSWTQLVADANRSSFSITQILPGLTTSGKQELVQLNGMDAANSVDNKLGNLSKTDGDESRGDGYKAYGVVDPSHLTVPLSSNVEENPAGMYIEQNNPEKKLQDVAETDEVSAPTFAKKPISAQKHTSAGDSKIGETFSFMRSAASMREWMTTKAALSGTLTRKSREK